jgi:hypothetical protein
VFEGVQLTGADVFWLAEASGTDGVWRAANLHLEGAILAGAQLERADLHEAQLTGANLYSATFDQTSHLNAAVLTGASLDQVTYTLTERATGRHIQTLMPKMAASLVDAGWIERELEYLPRATAWTYRVTQAGVAAANLPRQR